MRTSAVACLLASTATPALAESICTHPREVLPSRHDYAAATAGALDREGLGLEVYAGAQRVHDAGDAVTADLTVRTGRFRFRAAVTRFGGDEHRIPGVARLQTGEAMAVPGARTLSRLTVGMRLDDGGPTQILVEGGIAHAVMRVDPTVDADPIGGIAAARIEQRFTRRASALAEVALMGFISDAHAIELRVGARVGPVELSFRRLAFDIGPTLYGPELGLRF